MTWAFYGDDQLQAIAEIVRTGNDTITVIIGGAILDDTLRRTLSQRLRDDKNIRDKLFKPGGPMGNMVPKIDLLYMLSDFDKQVRNSLYGLADVRNFFAHNLNASFDSKAQKMKAAVEKLTLHESKKYYPHHIYGGDTKKIIEATKTSRAIFIVNLKLCLIALMHDRLSHDVWSNKPLTKKAHRDLKREWKRLEHARTEKP